MGSCTIYIITILFLVIQLVDLATVSEEKLNRKTYVTNINSGRTRREIDSWITKDGERVAISNAAVTAEMQNIVERKHAHAHRKKRALTASEQTIAVTSHNDYRKNEGSSDMIKMVWNDDLALLAQEWADGCDFVHGQPSGRTYTDYSSSSSMGQNLYVTSANTADIAAAITAWFDEKTDYTYSTASCAAGAVCGHYTAVVWASSVDVGCGITTCSPLYDTSLGAGHVLYASGTNVVCNYGPAGNLQNTKPYLQGDACTQCASGQFTCTDSLCDSCTAGVAGCTCEAACQNCGNSTNSCGCTCADGWTGVNCADVCENTNTDCGANPGWPVSWCGDASYPYVDSSCPLMCGYCTAATGNEATCGSGSGSGQNSIHASVTILKTVFITMAVSYFV